MKPLVLTMKAFGRYGEKTTLDFQELKDNLFLITGDTGAGRPRFLMESPLLYLERQAVTVSQRQQRKTPVERLLPELQKTPGPLT